MKVHVKHTNTSLKVRYEVVHTCSKCYTKFIDEPFKFLRKLKTFKLSVVKDNEWFKHEPRSVCSKVRDPFGVIDREKLTRLQSKLRREGLIRTQK